MKNLILCISFLAASNLSGQCTQVDRLFSMGDGYLKADPPNYREAIVVYLTILGECPDHAEEARQRIAGMVEALNRRKKEAATTGQDADNVGHSVQNVLDYLDTGYVHLSLELLERAKINVLYLHYEAALQDMKISASLGLHKEAVAQGLLETAFWYGEAGARQRAWGILDTAAALAGKKIDAGLSIRQTIEAFDSVFYQKMLERYYPVVAPVTGGEFEMGCPPGDTCKNRRSQQVGSFQMAIYETTYWQYNLFCKATGYQNKVQSKIMQGDHPVEYATWYDAIRYVNWLNKQLGLDKFYSIDSKGTAGLFGDFYHVRWNAGAKRGFRLPTEAEWEFAAKGGTTPENTLYSGSNNLGLVGWYNENSGFGPHAVGQKRANVLGLYDMSGNVWEWCWDSWTEGEKETSVKGLNGQRIQKYHVIRGGTWSYDAVDCQVGSRSYSEGPSFSNLIGFRVVYLE